MKIIKIKSCWECPFNEISNNINYCNNPKFKNQIGRIFKNKDELLIANNSFPTWCPLKDIK
jgi:hypothetical protein